MGVVENDIIQELPIARVSRWNLASRIRAIGKWCGSAIAFRSRISLTANACGRSGDAPQSRGDSLPGRTSAKKLASSVVKDREDNRGPRRILVMCLGGIGDAVLSFASLRDLRRACPNDHISAIAMWPQAAELLEDLGVFDEVLQHNFQRERVWKSLAMTWKLRRQRYDVSILSFPTNRFEYNVLAFLVGAKERWGHTYVRGGDFENLRFLLTDRVEQELGRHVIDENRLLIARFTGREPEKSADIRLGPLAPEYHSGAVRMFEHLKEPLIGIHAGCSTYKGHAARRWPAERFGHFCRLVHDLLGFQPVVFGLPSEIDLKLRIQALCPEAHLAHGETIRHTAALIGRCSAFVTNDSGLAHIASALDVPVVMACGATDARGIGPYEGHGVAVEAKLSCAPCFQVGRKPLRCMHATKSACMKQITVEQMLDVVSSLVKVPLKTNGSRQARGVPFDLAGETVEFAAQTKEYSRITACEAEQVLV